MDFYEVISKRRTVRDFEAEEIPKEVIERVVSAAMKAPTNDHMRDWHYIVVMDKAVAEKLVKTVPKGITDTDLKKLIRDWDLDNSVQQECYRNAVPKQYRMLFDASAIIVPLLKQKTDILHPENISHLNGFASIWCSIENLFLAATAEGYACNLRIPLGDESEHARKVLGFPKSFYMPCFIGIGRPRKEETPIRQIEVDLRERIHWNQF